MLEFKLQSCSNIEINHLIYVQTFNFIVLKEIPSCYSFKNLFIFSLLLPLRWSKWFLIHFEEKGRKVINVHWAPNYMPSTLLSSWLRFKMLSSFLVRQDAVGRAKIHRRKENLTNEIDNQREILFSWGNPERHMVPWPCGISVNQWFFN